MGTVSSHGCDYLEDENVRYRFFSEEEGIIEGEPSIWLTGFVRYADIFGGHYITGFNQAFDTFRGRFVARGGQAYNYTRNEKPDEIPAPSSRG